MIRQGLDGRRLPDEQWSSLQLHLETCVECNAYREQIAEIERGLQRGLRTRLNSVARAPGIGAAKEVTGDVFLARTARKQRRKVLGYAVLVLLGLLLIFLWRVYRAATAPALVPTQAPTPVGATATATPVVFTFRGVVAYAGPGEGEGAGTSDIYLYNPGSGPGTGELVNLTADPADDIAPAWSPDGEWLAFLSDRLETPADPKKYEVYVMHISGTRLTRLTVEPGVEWQGPLSWSVGGDWIALTGHRGGGRDSSYVYLVPVVSQLTGSDGARTLGLTRGAPGPVRFSPAAQKLAYGSSETPLQGISVYDFFSSLPVPVTWEDTHGLSLKPGVGGQFDWSFDGSLVAYLAEGPYHLLTGGLAAEDTTTYLKTTGRLTYTSLRDYSDTPLELEALAGVGIVRGLTTIPGAARYSVAYLRDEANTGCWTVHLRYGLQLVTTHNIPGLCVLGGLSRESWLTGSDAGERSWLVVLAHLPGNGRTGIYALGLPQDLEGSQLLLEALGDPPFAVSDLENNLPFLRVRPQNAASLDIRPSRPAPRPALPAPALPQGIAERVVFSTKAGLDSQVMAVDPGGGSLRILSAGGQQSHCPAWSPDRQRIAFLSDFNSRAAGVNELFTMDASGLYVTRISQPTFDIGAETLASASEGALPRYDCPVWAPDGLRLAAVLHTHSRDFLAIIPANGSEVSYIPIPRASSNASLAWSADGKRLALATHPDREAVRIQLLDLASLESGAPRFTLLARADGWDDIYAMAFDENVLVYITTRYTVNEGAVFNLHWVMPDGSEPREGIPLPGTSQEALTGGHLSILPAGQLAVLLNNRLESKVKSFIFRIDSESGRVESLVNLEEVVFDMDWSPDGRWVVYAAESGLYALDFAAGAAGSVSPGLIYDGRAYEVDWQ